MKNKAIIKISSALIRAIAVTVIACAPLTTGIAQTAGGTTISNQASATY